MAGMAAEQMAPSQEQLIVARKMRVAVGPEREIVEVKAGQPWPPDAPGKLDVLIRTGRVIRFDENGELDRRSYRFARRLGISPPPLYPVRSFLQRARGLPQYMTVDGQRVRVYPGQPDCTNVHICIVDGRAYGVFRGAPDDLAAREVLRLSLGGGRSAPRRRPSGARKKAGRKKAGGGEKKRRRRRVQE